MNLYFIRHGDPDYELDSLTERGHLQAKATAEKLVSEVNFDRVYSSPRGRAKQTADYYCKLANKQYEVLPWITEIEWGDLKGAPYSSGNPWDSANKMAHERLVNPQGDAWKKELEFINNRVTVDYEKRVALFDEFMKNEGYIYDDGVFKCEKENNDNIAFFCHGGITCTLFSHILDIPFTKVLNSMRFNVTSISNIEFFNNVGKYMSPACIYSNDFSHLRKLNIE